MTNEEVIALYAQWDESMTFIFLIKKNREHGVYNF